MKVSGVSVQVSAQPLGKKGQFDRKIFNLQSSIFNSSMSGLGYINYSSKLSNKKNP